MRVLIFEPQYVGHNFAYVDYLATRLIELGCETHLVTSLQARESEEFDKHLGHLMPELRCTALSGFIKRATARGISVNGVKGAKSLTRGLKEGLDRVNPEHLFVPSGNALANWLGVPNRVTRTLRARGIESELILLFGKYAYPHRGFRAYLKEKIALAALANGPWDRIHHILPHAVRVMSSYSRSMASRTRLLPDPIDPSPAMSRERAREMLGIPLDGRLVSLVGLIERRKGVVELLDTFQRQVAKLRPNDRVLLAGKATEEIRSLLRTQYHELVISGRVISLDRHLSREELWATCYGADLIATPYPNHVYSASIVIRAAAARRPVIANSIGWMKETIDRFGLGTTCNTNDPNEFDRALVQSLHRSESYVSTPQAQQFVRFHAESNFSNHLVQRVSERLGVEPRPSDFVHWSSVLNATGEIRQQAA